MPDGALHPGAPAPAAGGELVYVSDQEPGIRRRRAGRGFAYYDAEGRLLRDAEALERVRRLAIPPAWTDVWISPEADGHIQATGRDAKGRKQYRYHDRWNAERSGDKYGRMAAFGRALPRVRERVDHDLGRRGLSREKVLATAVRLLELTLIRVGNKEYARRNRSYGLTTLTKRHVDVDGTALKFRFKGKSGVEHDVHLRDRRLAGVLRSMRDLRGQHLFKWKDAEGALHAVESADVNAYIREASGEDFTAKDFRTWAATVSAARALCLEGAPESRTAAKKATNRCVKAVAGLLGNTPTVCRSSYIHPRVLEAFAEGRLCDAFPGADDPGFEAALIAFLEAEEPRRPEQPKSFS
jgi:DNA topoisomerase-1